MHLHSTGERHVARQSVQYAAFLLRIALGTMFLAHSVILKLFVFTLPGTAGFFQSLGLPGWTAYATFAAEAVGGVLLILGVQSRWVALALLPILHRRDLDACGQRLGVQRAEWRLGVSAVPEPFGGRAGAARRRRLRAVAVARAAVVRR